MLDFEDEIVRDTVVAHGNDVSSARLRDLLGLAPLATPETPSEETA